MPEADATVPSGQSWKSTEVVCSMWKQLFLGALRPWVRPPAGAAFPMPWSTGESQGFMVAMETVIVALIRLCAGFLGSRMNNGWCKVFCIELEAVSADRPVLSLGWQRTSEGSGRLGNGTSGSSGRNCFRVVATYPQHHFQKSCPNYTSPTRQESASPPPPLALSLPV